MPRRLSVNDLYEPEPNSGCWLWTGVTDSWGYGRAGRAGMAHRVFYERIVGAIPKGLTLDHKCRVRCCVNPDHLEPVTLRENLRRGSGFPGLNARKTHCRLGHDLSDPRVLYLTPTGKRNCRICRRAAAERWANAKH